MHTKTTLASAAIFGLISTGLTISPAVANPNNPISITGAPPSISPHSSGTTIKNNDVVSHYYDTSSSNHWTPARMRKSVPVEPPAIPDNDVYVSKSSEPVTTQETQPIERISEPLDGEYTGSSNNEDYSITNGKLMMQVEKDGDPNYNTHCSGSVINTPSKRIVVTAAHCLVTDDYEYPTQMAFMPGYDDGKMPVNGFQIQSSHIHQNYYKDIPMNEKRRVDIAFLVTAVDAIDERPIAQQVGGHGFAINGTTSWDAATFGYPNNFKDAETQTACRGTTEMRQIKPDLTPLVINNCTIAEGGSGGPWLDEYDSKSSKGVLRSIVSTGTDGTDNNGEVIGSPEVHGPYLGAWAQDVYKVAEGDA